MTGSDRINSQRLSTTFRTDQDNSWIKELGTAVPCGCNVNIKGVSNTNNPENSDVNAMKLFDTNQLINRSPGRRSLDRFRTSKAMLEWIHRGISADKCY